MKNDSYLVINKSKLKACKNMVVEVIKTLLDNSLSPDELTDIHHLVNIVIDLNGLLYDDTPSFPL